MVCVRQRSVWGHKAWSGDVKYLSVSWGHKAWSVYVGDLSVSWGHKVCSVYIKDVPVSWGHKAWSVYVKYVSVFWSHKAWSLCTSDVSVSRGHKAWSGDVTPPPPPQKKKKPRGNMARARAHTHTHTYIHTHSYEQCKLPLCIVIHSWKQATSRTTTCNCYLDLDHGITLIMSNCREVEVGGTGGPEGRLWFGWHDSHTDRGDKRHCVDRGFSVVTCAFNFLPIAYARNYVNKETQFQ